MDRHFDTPEPVELLVELGAGALHVEAGGTGHSSVTIDGPRAEEFTVELRERRLTVIAPRPRGGFVRGNDSHAVRVSVPAGSDLTTRTGSADTEAAGRYGRVRAKTGSGAFTVDTAEGEVDLIAGSGRLRCGSAASGARVKTGSGDVVLGVVQGQLGVSTGSGDVSVSAAPGHTVLKTGSGSTVVGRTDGDLSALTGSGSVRIDHARPGRVRARTGSGDIRVGVSEGTPVWTDVHTGSGRIASSLAAVGKPADGQEHLELRLTTGSGDIVLTQV